MSHRISRPETEGKDAGVFGKRQELRKRSSQRRQDAEIAESFFKGNSLVLTNSGNHKEYKELKLELRIKTLRSLRLRAFARELLTESLRFILILFFLGAALNVYALDDVSAGDAAVAARYAQWAKDAVENGRWNEALAGLERASDFADVSSDISYLLALARSHENKSRLSVLGALDKALAIDRWNMYSGEEALLLRADMLIGVRAYGEALFELSKVSRSPQEAVLALRALESFRTDDFRRYMTDALDLYPRHSGPARVFFSFLSKEEAAGRSPGKDDRELLELILRRLPVLALNDPELAWMAAPYMRDSAEAGRQVSAYRAVNKPAPASLPAALQLGIIDEETALEELFVARSGALDLGLLGKVWDLLRREEAKSLFRRNLSAYTGVITEDADMDGIPESSAEYYAGMLRLYTHDAEQDGVPDLTVFFEAGDPRRARSLIPAEAYGDRKTAEILWERYPAILEAELDGVKYIPRPFEFYFSPVKFEELRGSGVLFPRRDPLSPSLTRRTLVFGVFRIERASSEFPSGKELVELSQGIPERAREYVNNLKVSETEFLRGRPQLQRLDLDFDGRIDTVRRFSRMYRPMEIEDLWNYDRDIEYSVTVEDLDVEW